MRACLQAYCAFLPQECMEAECPEDPEEVWKRWRALQFGNLATLITTENRISGGYCCRRY